MSKFEDCAQLGLNAAASGEPLNLDTLVHIALLASVPAEEFILLNSFKESNHEHHHFTRTGQAF